MLFIISSSRRVRRYHWIAAGLEQQSKNEHETLRQEIIHGCPAQDEDQRTRYVRLLRRCSDLAALEEGKLLHGHIDKSGFAGNCYLGNLLVHMYGRCGCLAEAEQVFHGIAQRNVFSWTILLTAFAQNGYFGNALHLYHMMLLEGVEPCRATFIGMLISSATCGQLEQARLIHSHIASTGWELDVQIATSMINMYGKCGSLEQARLVFERMQARDVVSWNTIMSVYIRRGHSSQAVELYCHMRLNGTTANRNTFATVVEACASSGGLVPGRQVHQHILESGLETDVVLNNCLVNMYAKCGCLDDAKFLFDGLGNSRNLVSWNLMISAYSHNGCGELAFETVRTMWLQGHEPDKFTFLSLVDSCQTRQALELLHSRIAMASLGDDVLVETSLVKTYARFGLVEAARDVFERVGINRDIICWNAMLSTYSQNGRHHEVVEMLQNMDLLGVKPNKASLTSILEACDLAEQGYVLHERIGASGYETDLLVGTALVNMYGRCRRLDEARRVFDKVERKDMLVWTSMIASAVDNGCPSEALHYFQAMELEGFKANKVTLVCVVDACTSVADAYMGEQIHHRICCSAWESDTVVANSLIHMYSKCRMPDKAWTVFEQLQERDIISWNGIISAAAVTTETSSTHLSSMDVYRRMSLDGFKPDTVSFLGILEGCCTSVSSENAASQVDAARLVHSHIAQLCGIQQGLDMVCTTLIDIYGKAGQVQDAEAVFREVKDKTDVVSWNAMAAGYLESGNARATLQLLRQMDATGVKANKVTLSVVLQACGMLADVSLVSAMHQRVATEGLDTEATVGNTLVAVYGTGCANLVAARVAFGNIQGRKNVVAWNGMLLVLARHGQLGQIIELLRNMDLEGVKPNDASLTSILFACNHAGLLLEAARCFCHMTSDHGIVASAAHYSCLVGLLGRAGWANQAEELIEGMPFAASAFEWMALLSSVQDHELEDKELSQRAALRVLELEPGIGAPYITLCNQLTSFN